MHNLGVVSELCIQCPNGMLVIFVGVKAYYGKTGG